MPHRKLPAQIERKLQGYEIEIRRLQKELKEVKLERDRLKEIVEKAKQERLELKKRKGTIPLCPLCYVPVKILSEGKGYFFYECRNCHRWGEVYFRTRKPMESRWRR